MALPFENLDKMIVDIIQEFTVPIFSIYVPDKKISTVNAKESFKVLNQTTSHTTYLLPDFKEPKLLYVFDMYNNEDALTNLGYYAGTIPFSMTEGSLMGEMMLSNMTARMINAAVPKLTFDFEPPRTLKVYNAFWTNTFTIEWGFEHSKSLNTIYKNEFYSAGTFIVASDCFDGSVATGEVDASVFSPLSFSPSVPLPSSASSSPLCIVRVSGSCGRVGV